jgi:hypothetical protein
MFLEHSTPGDITIAPPPAPFTVDKVDGNLEVGYASSPNSGTGVVATYKTLEPSIIGALSEASSHWLELTVDGTAQNPRERILSVPFAQVAGALTKGVDNKPKGLEYEQAIIISTWSGYQNLGDRVFRTNEAFLELSADEICEVIYSNNRLSVLYSNSAYSYETSVPSEWNSNYAANPIIGPCKIKATDEGKVVYKVMPKGLE